MDKSISRAHEKDELVSRQAALDAIDLADFTTDRNYADGKTLVFYDSAVQALKGLPAVDAVPVVRCKDCTAYQQTSHWCNLLVGEMQPTDYCSYGERREENEVD